MKDGFEIVVTMIAQLEERVKDLEGGMDGLIECIEIINQTNRDFKTIAENHQKTIEGLVTLVKELRQEDSIGNDEVRWYDITD